MKFEIKHQFTGEVLFALETVSLRLCIEAAVKAGADLTGADLTGADLTGANLYGANLTKEVEFVQVAGIGSVRRSTVYRIDTNEVRCGCFRGTLNEFRKKVSDSYPGGKHRAQYDAAIAFFAACKKAHKAK